MSYTRGTPEIIAEKSDLSTPKLQNIPLNFQSPSPWLKS